MTETDILTLIGSYAFIFTAPAVGLAYVRSLLR